MDNKAPGTKTRPGGYDTAGGATTTENFFHPKLKMKKSVQRAGFRSARRVLLCFSVVIGAVVIAPSYLGPFYVNYVASRNWLERASKSIWTRRNEKDYELYMTQRKNGWWEYLGLKHYNIGGEANVEPMEKSVRELVADADSPKAHRHIRETMKLNKFTSTLMLLALLAPVAALVSFYGAKFREVREKWVDPYELPPDFDPKTGRFVSRGNPQGTTGLPASLILGGISGRYNSRAAQ